MRKVMVAAMAMVLILGITACGGAEVMTVDQYREQMSELHGSVIASLEANAEDLSSLDYGDFFALADLQVTLAVTSEAFASAYQEALAMNTPPQVEDLHEDLLIFYSLTEEKIGDMANAIAFLQGILPMLTDVQNLALPNIPQDSNVSRIKAAAEEDATTMHGYLKQLKGMRPPQDLQPFKDDLTTFFHSIEEAVAGVERAVTPEDTSALQRFQQDFPAMLERLRIIRGEIQVYLFFYQQEMENLIRWGNELAERIEAV